MLKVSCKYIYSKNFFAHNLLGFVQSLPFIDSTYVGNTLLGNDENASKIFTTIICIRHCFVYFASISLAGFLANTGQSCAKLEYS